MFPTLIDVANLDPDSINRVHDGISLSEVFEREPNRRHKPLGFRASDGRMWMDNDWKIVQNVSFTKEGFITQPLELYNVVGDPSEEQNLIELYPQRAARMQAELAQWSISVSRSALGADYKEETVLPSGRVFDPTVDKRRRARMAQWAEEVREADRN
ncbi:MAG: hypothetical protein CM15mP120_09570 [Pseudomonadota bacterium]|nr:MAG: hypothetical protein CM15mP120_09570 [Pseudomonadota bacterium]